MSCNAHHGVDPPRQGGGNTSRRKSYVRTKMPAVMPDNTLPISGDSTA